MNNSTLRKPSWIRSKNMGNDKFGKVAKCLSEKHLNTVCQAAHCPNQAECFARGTATFMVMGNVCTRNCHFCNVQHGIPQALDTNEPEKLIAAIKEMHLHYVVITSVTRDDLVDGGASHFVSCIKAIRVLNPKIKIEILVPDFRHCFEKVLNIFAVSLPDIFNHNIETVPNLYTKVRPQADYAHSLKLLLEFKLKFPFVPTKSGMMLGLGETKDEVINVLNDLRKHKVDMLTLGQYLQPTKSHLPIAKYVIPDEFSEYAKIARELGFSKVASGPMVRSSYYADLQ
jgi:lipoyl synthase